MQVCRMSTECVIFRYVRGYFEYLWKDHPHDAEYRNEPCCSPVWSLLGSEVCVPGMRQDVFNVELVQVFGLLFRQSLAVPLLGSNRDTRASEAC